MKKILIANRGEIACRIIDSCKKLKFHSIAVYSDVDKNSLQSGKLSLLSCTIDTQNSNHVDMENSGNDRGNSDGKSICNQLL